MDTLDMVKELQFTCDIAELRVGKHQANHEVGKPQPKVRNLFESLRISAQPPRIWRNRDRTETVTNHRQLQQGVVASRFLTNLSLDCHAT